MSTFRILLLTNRDSDNIGDHLIEESVIAILGGIMKNLDIPPERYRISSRAAGIVTKKYMRTGDPALLEPARKAVAAADVVVFGGAPLFNYRYQNFYLRTITTLRLAEQYGVPVIFSSIGVEKFDPTNPKSVALKEALALPCVRQITTRDDLESAQRYVEGTGVHVSKVADPAVLADIVFSEVGELRPVKGSRKPRGSRKTVGLVVARRGIFADNGIAFTPEDQRRFWLEVIALLDKRGYDYRVFTTGHYADEMFLDTLVRADGVPLSRASVTVNSPEELISELTACDGVVAFRLHASIASFAFGIPAIGLSWNFKVPYFYESVGHADRALGPERWNAQEVVTALEKAMSEGVKKDEALLSTAYDALFTGLRDVVAPHSTRAPYSYAELRTELPRFPGTTPAKYREKVDRKLRRAYEQFTPRSSAPAPAPSAPRPPAAPPTLHLPPVPAPRPRPTFARRVVRRLRRSWARMRAVTR